MGTGWLIDWLIVVCLSLMKTWMVNFDRFGKTREKKRFSRFIPMGFFSSWKFAMLLISNIFRAFLLIFLTPHFVLQVWRNAQGQIASRHDQGEESAGAVQVLELLEARQRIPEPVPVATTSPSGRGRRWGGQGSGSGHAEKDAQTGWRAQDRRHAVSHSHQQEDVEVLVPTVSPLLPLRPRNPDGRRQDAWTFSPKHTQCTWKCARFLNSEKKITWKIFLKRKIVSPGVFLCRILVFGDAGTDCRAYRWALSVWRRGGCILWRRRECHSVCLHVWTRYFLSRGGGGGRGRAHCPWGVAPFPVRNGSCAEWMFVFGLVDAMMRIETLIVCFPPPLQWLRSTLTRSKLSTLNGMRKSTESGIALSLSWGISLKWRLLWRRMSCFWVLPGVDWIIRSTNRMIWRKWNSMGLECLRRLVESRETWPSSFPETWRWNR